MSIASPYQGCGFFRQQQARRRRLANVRTTPAGEVTLEDVMRLKAKAQAARSKALEASDVRSMASQGYKFLIQRRTGGIDIKNGNARAVGGPSLPQHQRRAQAEQEDTTPKK